MLLNKIKYSFKIDIPEFNQKFLTIDNENITVESQSDTDRKIGNLSPVRIQLLHNQIIKNLQQNEVKK